MSSDYSVYQGKDIKWFIVENNYLKLNTLYNNGENEGELLVTSSKDEDGKETHEYSNKDGQTIMTESYDGTLWNQSYYVYDDFGLLRYMLTPQAEESFSAAGVGTTYTYNTDWVKGFCYYYEYDARKTANYEATTRSGTHLYGLRQTRPAGNEPGRRAV